MQINHILHVYHFDKHVIDFMLRFLSMICLFSCFLFEGAFYYHNKNQIFIATFSQSTS